MLRHVLPLVLLASTACDGPGSGSDAPARRVVLITCDTLRADRLGAYGYELPTSPNIDRFASESVLFEEAYACAPHTGPAVSAMFAGRLPDEIGVSGGNRTLMPSSVVTLPEILRDEGVQTAAIVSNWVLRRVDPKLGDIGVQQGFEHFDDRMNVKELNRNLLERVAPDTTDAAIEWLQQRGKADRFFLWVHYQDPHGPYLPPPELHEQFKRPLGDDPPLVPNERARGLGKLPRYQVIEDERHPDQYRARYDAEIAWFDRELGRLFDHLRDTGLWEESLIVFSSDHGESLGEHDYWFCHGENLFREVMRVPLVVRYPEGCESPAARGGKIRDLTGHLDLWPTVLDAFGIRARPSRGESLLAKRLPTGRVVPHTLWPRGTAERWLGVSDGRWRLLLQNDAPARLFDIEADPLELNNLAESAPDRAKRLLDRYRAMLASMTALELAGADMPMDAEARRALAGLGYLDSAEEPPDED